MYVAWHTKRQVYYKIRSFTMFITAVCVFFYYVHCTLHFAHFCPFCPLNKKRREEKRRDEKRGEEKRREERRREEKRREEKRREEKRREEKRREEKRREEKKVVSVYRSPVVAIGGGTEI